MEVPLFEVGGGLVFERLPLFSVCSLLISDIVLFSWISIPIVTGISLDRFSLGNCFANRSGLYVYLVLSFTNLGGLAMCYVQFTHDSENAVLCWKGNSCGERISVLEYLKYTRGAISDYLSLMGDRGGTLLDCSESEAVCDRIHNIISLNSVSFSIICLNTISFKSLSYWILYWTSGLV